MNFSELGKMIEVISKERGIEKEIVVRAIEQAFLVTARKKFGFQGEYETRYNMEDDDVEIFQYKSVVEEVRDPILEITLNDAQNLEKEEDVEVGDQLGIKIENPNFTRVDVQTARQIIFQKVRDAEREILFSEYKHREGTLITGVARRYERGNLIVSLGRADAILFRREIIPEEKFGIGDRIQACLTEVLMTNRGPEIRLSRTSPMFLVKLFETEVPEIQDGTIEIKAAAREPGFRAKVAVTTTDTDIDPVGACVGMKGSRVLNIVNELQGEKIDIVRWNPDIVEFAKLSLAPAEILNVMHDEKEKTMDIVVEEDQLSLSIGRRGQNVRLCAMLTGNKINIISKTKLQEKIQKSVENLLQVPKVNESYAQLLVQREILSILDLVESPVSEIKEFLNIEEQAAQEILNDAKAVVDAGEVALQLEEDETLISAYAIPTYRDGGELKREDSKTEQSDGGKDKFSEAERRLREELATFKLK